MTAGTSAVLSLAGVFGTRGSAGDCFLLWGWLHFRGTVGEAL